MATHGAANKGDADKPKALSKKHQEFINWYLQLWNQTEAYKRVYPKSSDAAARAHAARLVADGSIAEEISRRVAERTMSADEVLIGLADHARADIGRWLSDDGAINIAAMKADGATKFIKKVKRTERSGVSKDGGEWSIVTGEVELYDALAAKQMIARHHGLLTDKVEHSGEIEIVDATDPRERIASRIAVLAQRRGAESGTERPDGGGSEGA